MQERGVAALERVDERDRVADPRAPAPRARALSSCDALGLAREVQEVREPRQQPRGAAGSPVAERRQRGVRAARSPSRSIAPPCDQLPWRARARPRRAARAGARGPRSRPRARTSSPRGRVAGARLGGAERRAAARSAGVRRSGRDRSARRARCDRPRPRPRRRATAVACSAACTGVVDRLALAVEVAALEEVVGELGGAAPAAARAASSACAIRWCSRTRRLALWRS